MFTSFMKSSKMQGGFVHGRSTKESVLTKFVVGLLCASNISEGHENFVASVERMDACESRVKRYQEDVKKLSKWFCTHNPFSKCTNDHVYSKWGYRQCGKDKLLRSTEH
ncbi:hypothetical protein AVEN_198773-1 [Araneus ventricosus]|uniref:Uncharacterized protein n=1 Tax=Araneus ventricosus TaxID=182803 RepID=A0A4Y2I5Y1_ARAVE|nr:hypothetical protein AVEN_198773-1 [Araneus ventricosus]